MLTLWLTHLPIAILAALVTSEFKSNGQVNLIYLWSGLITAFVGYKTKNLLITTASGVLMVVLVRRMF